MNDNLKRTLREWPIVAAAVIGLCFLTQSAAKLFGIDLPDQQNVDVVRRWLLHAFDSRESLRTCAFLLAQVLLLLPIVEEAVFRWLLFRQPTRLAGMLGGHRTATAVRFAVAAVSSALFSAAHYVYQPFPDAAFAALFLFGLAQCRLYAKTGRLWCPMLNHALFNLTNVVLLLVLPQ